MTEPQPHTFHIPVMGLGYSVDTPLKVGRFGISSVISVMEDNLIEQMRAFHCREENEDYVPIEAGDMDHRAKRITAYLNLLNRILTKQMNRLSKEPFEQGYDIVKYFDLLPDGSPLKKAYLDMHKPAPGPEKETLQEQLRARISPGAIDVNIMTKADKTNYSGSGEQLPVEYCDAMAALRGFALSDLSSSIVFSAGLNPRLYSYCETFKDFFPDENGKLKKKITLKVSDYRSALIQGKLFAKKGLWVSEFRIESGLNCGGHAFVTDGILLGSVLEEFKSTRTELLDELFQLCNGALLAKGISAFSQQPEMKITVQGGIGTAKENKFLLEYYNLDGTGWGSPFLLVPEATNVDEETLRQLASAKQDDYYVSNASPMGIPFNNFHKSSAEKQRKKRIAKGRPGSPCYKKFLASSTEFTTYPICTASRQFQALKIKQLGEKHLTGEHFRQELESITEKDCLCEGLSAPALLKNNIPPPHRMKAVTICPGPNLAFFSGTFSLKEMVDHIYGRINILNTLPRPHLFINELRLNLDYFKKEIMKNVQALTVAQLKKLHTFRDNLLRGIAYYKELCSYMRLETEHFLSRMKKELERIELEIRAIVLPQVAGAGLFRCPER